MANIEKISVGGTSYDVRDANAAHALTDIATAGDNVTFTTPTIDDYSIQGTGVTVTSGVASGFTTSSYIYKAGLWSQVAAAGAFEFQIKFKLTSLPSDNRLTHIKSGSYGYDMFDIYFTSGGSVGIKIGNDYFGSASSTVGTGVDYWLKFIQNVDTSRVIKLSTDGINFTDIITNITSGTFAASSENFVLGAFPGSYTFAGSIDLTETNFKDSNGNVIWAASAPAGLPFINATVPTVDQTYSSSSTNAQSGVAINNAKFIRNLATGTNALSIGGGYASSQNWAVNIGSASQATCASGIAIGSGAKALTTSYSTAVGVDASATKGVAIGAYSVASNNAIALGNGTSASLTTSASGLNAIALGQQAVASGSQSIMIGTGESNAAFSIQLGYGMNSTANTFSVGLSASNNYRLLESDGTIPSARMPSDVLKNIATATNSYSFAGALVDTANPRSYSLAIGPNATNTSNYSMAIGMNARAAGSGTAVGLNARHWGSCNYSTSLGREATIGVSPSTGANYAMALGGQAVATANGAIQIGKGTNSTASSLSVGLVDGSGNGSSYTLLKSDGKIPGERMALQGAGAPTTATVGSVGQFYVDTTNQVGYMCVSDASSTYVWKQITA